MKGSHIEIMDFIKSREIAILFQLHQLTMYIILNLIKTQIFFSL